MFTATVTTQTNYIALINAHLYGTPDQPSPFESNESRDIYPMPHVLYPNDECDELIQELIYACAERDEDGHYGTFSPEMAAENILDTVYEDGADAVVEWLQEDLHEMFPNEKMWPHLDALAETAAHRYYADVYSALVSHADLVQFHNDPRETPMRYSDFL